MPVTGRLARQLIAACTRPGDLVIDLFPADHMLVSNARILGRRVTAVVTDPGMAGIIWTRATTGCNAQDTRRVEARVVGSQKAHRALADRHGEAALVVVRRNCWPTASEMSIGESAEQGSLSEPAELLARRGHLAVVTGLHHVEDRLHDPVPELVRSARQAGLIYLQHIVAVHGPVRRGHIVMSLLPANLAPKRMTPGASGGGVTSTRAHADVLLFTKPLRAGVAAERDLRGEEGH